MDGTQVRPLAGPFFNMEKYKGAIVEESLEDNRILNDFKVSSISVTKEDNPEERWHICNVEATKKQIENLSKNIKPSKWYAHFWNSNKDVIAIFRGKIFYFNYNDKKSWNPAIKYGRSIGIPREQLDFIID